MDDALNYYSSTRIEIGPLLPPRIRSILEIGCGTGATMAWIRSIRQIEHAVGIELSATAAREASLTFDEVIVGNVETLGLRFSEPFDVVLALDVLEHLVDPWSVLRRIGNLLSPDGAVLASIPNVAHYKVVIPLLFHGSWDYANNGILDRTHLRFFTRESALTLFTSSGFLIDEIDYVRRYPNLFPKPGSNRWRWYSLKIMAALLPERMFNFQFLIRARPKTRSEC